MITRGRSDRWLLAAALMLTAFGILMVYSASANYASARLGDGAYFLKRQAGAAAFGLVLLWMLTRIGYRRLEWTAVPLLFFSIVLLILVRVPGLGHVAGGARRWLHIGPLTFQPSELAKVALVFFLARSLAKKGDTVRDFRTGFLPHALITLVLIGLLMLQPDFGTTLSVAALTWALLFVAGARLSHLVLTVLLAVPPVVLLVIYAPYRLRRLLAFLHPDADPTGVGYQVHEALISIGSGGLTGQGLGESRQKLFYLPAAHTDFILPIIGEETGLFGIAMVVALFLLLAWRGLRAARAAPDAFGAYLAVGLTALLCLETLVNAGMSMGLLPTKGMALPFLSYGGTSLVVSMAVVGLLLSVSSGPGGYLRAPTGAR